MWLVDLLFAALYWASLLFGAAVIAVCAASVFFYVTSRLSYPTAPAGPYPRSAGATPCGVSTVHPEFDAELDRIAWRWPA